MAYPKILVVDDEPQILDLISRALATGDYEVVSMSCPIEALEFAQATPCFDLVVSDVIMPGMCGPEFVRRISEIWPGAAVILMSGFLYKEVVPTHVEFLTKPFAVGDLFAVVDRALASRIGGPEVRSSAHAAGT